MAPIIVADEKVPHLQEALGGLGTLIAVSAADIPRWINRADALVVRSVTRVDRSLLQGSRVRWVGSATAGLDHVDRTDLEKQGIRIDHAPGANAPAVVEYVVAAASVAMARGLAPRSPLEPWWTEDGPRWGVVGFGQIGRRLTRLLRNLGCSVRVCDPPLARTAHESAAEDTAWHRMAVEEDYCSLEDVLSTCDVVTLHVPLHREGPDPTFHLLDLRRIQQCRPGTLVINASRGSVVAGGAVSGRSPALWILDVWEHEPNLDWSLLTSDRLLLGTPHVAGYTREAKVAATRALHLALCRFLNAVPFWHGPTAEEPRVELMVPKSPLPSSQELADILDRTVGLTAMDTALRSLAPLDEAERRRGFEKLRASHRRELSGFRLPPDADLSTPVRRVLRQLGVTG